MATPSRPTLPGLSATHECPLPERPDIRNWSENFCLQAYDPSAEHGVWLHAGLPVYDFNLWHDITVIYLPGGSDVLLAKGLAPRGSAATISGSMLGADYDEKCGEWTWHFHGGATRADRGQLAVAPAVGGPTEPLNFALRFRGMGPVWDLNTKADGKTAFSHAHWQQSCWVEGSIEYGGSRITFEGKGIRDHSRGPRDMFNLGQHYWLCDQFPSGRAFSVVSVEATTVYPPISTAFIVENGTMRDAEVVSVPSDRSFEKPAEIVLREPGGDHRITGRLLHDMSFSIKYPDEFLLGYRDGAQQHWLREGQVRWTWDGETGYGLGERSVVLDASGNPEIR